MEEPQLGQIIKKIPEKGDIFIETGRTVDMVKISIKDNGEGMSKEIQEHIFDPFFTTRAVGQGTGLGLSICQRLIHLMGGRIWVESEAGAGSSFIFTGVFGLHKEKKIPLLPDPDLRGKRVLVVDDNQTSRLILQDMLESMSFKVSQSASGQEAVTEIIQADEKGEPFEVIYMDWQMPDMNGIATSKKIKEQELSRQPKIIMVTAYGREEIMQQAEKINLIHLVGTQSRLKCLVGLRQDTVSV